MVGIVIVHGGSSVALPVRDASCSLFGFVFLTFIFSCNFSKYMGITSGNVATNSLQLVLGSLFFSLNKGD